MTLVKLRERCLRIGVQKKRWNGAISHWRFGYGFTPFTTVVGYHYDAIIRRQGICLAR